jgi:hypothetical protein
MSLVFASGLLAASPATAAASFFFSTGFTDGRIATLSGKPSPAGLSTETADDFILDQPTRLKSATFEGLLPLGASLVDVGQVEIEFYHVFPRDSGFPPSGNVPTRVNSPADSEIGAATRDSAAGTLSFSPAIVGPTFTASNSVVHGVNKSPNQFTGGEGAVTGEEVLFNVTFTTPIVLPEGHYFFRPSVTDPDNFLWLSAPKPITAPGTPFAPDLQAWMRNDDLAPDWLRIGTDITAAPPFNMTFSLSGAAVPEPAVWAMMLTGLAGVGALCRSRRRRGALAR